MATRDLRPRPTSFSIDVAAHGKTTALVYRARAPDPDPGAGSATIVLAPGAGAGQTHPFMIDIATRLAARGLDVVTFDFLYMQVGRKMPDRTNVLEATWRAAIASVRARAGLPSARLRARFPTSRLFIGGKSMGGRIATHVAAAGDGGFDGVVLLGYPLHPIDKPKVRRDEHLPSVPCRMLFVQGSRDELGDAREMRAVVRKLPRAELHVVKGGDHSLALPKRDGAEAQESALAGAADAIARFVKRVE